MTYVDSFGNVRLAGGPDELRGAFGEIADETPLVAVVRRPRARPRGHALRRRPSAWSRRARRWCTSTRSATWPWPTTRGTSRRASASATTGRSASPGPEPCAGPFITFLTDFGDTAPATCRGVIWSILPEARINDLTHGSPPVRHPRRRLPALVVGAVPAGRRAPRRRRSRRRDRATADRAARGARRPASSARTTGCSLPAAERLGGIIAAHVLDNRALWRAETSRPPSTAATSSRRWPPTWRAGGRSPMPARRSTRPISCRSPSLSHGSRAARSRPASCSSTPSGTAALPARPRTLRRSAAAWRRAIAFAVSIGDRHHTVPWQADLRRGPDRRGAPLRRRRLRRAWGSASTRDRQPSGSAWRTTRRSSSSRPDTHARARARRGRGPHLPVPARDGARGPRHLPAHRSRARCCSWPAHRAAGRAR